MLKELTNSSIDNVWAIVDIKKIQDILIGQSKQLLFIQIVSKVSDSVGEGY